jgi:pectate lyase
MVARMLALGALVMAGCSGEVGPGGDRDAAGVDAARRDGAVDGTVLDAAVLDGAVLDAAYADAAEADAGGGDPRDADRADARSVDGSTPSLIDPRYFAWPDGWADTAGGRGGRIIRVTSLAASGPGTLRAAIESTGARIIVFEISGNIDLDGALLTIAEPFVTIAGQTAPSPGITLIGGGIETRTHDVVIQHLRIRPGTAAGDVADALETQSGSRDVIVDHCSLSWGTDEILSAAGYAFDGSSLAEWRESTSHRITFSHNIVAEALDASGQSYGTLVEDNATEILLFANYYAHNKERTPNFSGATQGAVINNLIYDPGGKFLDYTFLNSKWDAEGDGMRVAGRLTAIGNVGRAGPSTGANAFFETVSNGDVEYYAEDNIATRVDGSSYPATVMSSFLSPQGRILVQATPPVMPPGLVPMPSSDVEAYVTAVVGARPWDRDAHDLRVLADHADGTGSIIDSQADVGGYPASVETTRAFDEALWDLDTMTPLSADAL